MVLVLFFLGTIILILFTAIVIMLSYLKINIKNLEVQNILMPEKKYDIKAEIGLYLFGKIPLLKTSTKKSKFKKTKIVEILKSTRIDSKFKRNAETIERIKMLSPKLETLTLDIKIGTEDALYTAFFVSTISTLISLILPYIVKLKNSDKIKYELTPMYTGKNVISINLSSIICIKMVHIINIIYIVLQKRRDEKNERTSNRRAYAHSYE